MGSRTTHCFPESALPGSSVLSICVATMAFDRCAFLCLWLCHIPYDGANSAGTVRAETPPWQGLMAIKLCMGTGCIRVWLLCKPGHPQRVLLECTIGALARFPLGEVECGSHNRCFHGHTGQAAECHWCRCCMP